jgi:hypothetical protein
MLSEGGFIEREASGFAAAQSIFKTRAARLSLAAQFERERYR